MKNVKLKLILTIIIAVFTILGIKSNVNASSLLGSNKLAQSGWYCLSPGTPFAYTWIPYYQSGGGSCDTRSGSTANKIHAYIMGKYGINQCHGGGWRFFQCLSTICLVWRRWIL